MRQMREALLWGSLKDLLHNIGREFSRIETINRKIWFPLQGCVAGNFFSRISFDFLSRRGRTSSNKFPIWMQTKCRFQRQKISPENLTSQQRARISTNSRRMTTHTSDRSRISQLTTRDATTTSRWTTISNLSRNMNLLISLVLELH